jgi:hypothetical protein
MLRLTPDNLSRAQAVSAILAAVASDTVSKVAIGAAIGRGWFAADLAPWHWALSQPEAQPRG